MSNLTLLPIHLDGLLLRAEKSVVEAMADFSRLPYFDQVTGRDVNPNTAYVSEEVVSEPFQNDDLRLRPGIHLHWSLPDALTKTIGFPTLRKTEILNLIPSGAALWEELLDKNWIKLINKQLASILPAELRKGALFSDYQPYLSRLLPLFSRPQANAFPAVPDRWLISRSVGGRLEKQWIVESDYLYPEGKGTLSGSITYPFLPDWDERSSRPFRFMGRKLPLDVWLQQTRKDGDRYLNDLDEHYLSAVGYGEPTFSAFYPNCHSVFGLHDDDYAQDYPPDLQYELIGWYAQPENDFLQVFLQDFENKYTGKPEGLTAAKWQALQTELKWTADPAMQVNPPGPLVCFAHITFQPEASAPTQLPASATYVTVGNTATEALSAFLAKEIAPGQKYLVEDQLESLLLADHLDHRNLDVGAKFYEARHEKGFNAVSSGLKWTIRMELEQPGPATAPEEKASLDLPDQLARQLDQLNALQEAYDQKQAVIVALRRQLFADWYKYQLSCYPPESSRDPGLDIDLVKYFMEEKGIRAIREMERLCGRLLIEKDGTGRPRAARALDDHPGSLSKQVAGAVAGLLTAIAAFNTLETTQKAKQEAVLKTESGPRFWQPKEPVVLIMGDQVAATDRHGQDGRLHPEGYLSAHLLPVAEQDAHGSRLLHGQYNSIRKFILALKNTTPENIAFRSWDGNPWHPLLLEWEVEVFPKKLGLDLDGAEGNYHPNFMIDNYELKLNEPDLEGKVSEDTVTRSAQLYRGRSLLTPQAGIQVKEQLEEHVEHSLKEEITRAFFKETKVAAGNRNDTWLETHFQDFLAWIKGKAYNWQAWQAASGPDADPLFTQWISANIEIVRHWFVSENPVLIAYKNSDYYRIAPEQWDPFIHWLREHTDLKNRFFSSHGIPPEHQESYWNEQPDVFLSWFKTIAQDLSYFYWENDVAEADQNDDYLRAQLESLVDWYQSEVRTAYQLRVLSEAYKKLSGLNSLSQTLSGFNDALLMHKLSLQVAIADPLGFEEDRTFAEKVKQAVGPYRDIAPQPWNDFAPIRNGLMKIQHLRLIDTFGQSRELIEKGDFLYGPAINTSEPFDGPNNKLLLSLPPRLSQPARLNCRWLAAADDVQEMNDHPASSPIFGWLMANHLDQSIMVYDEQGQAIGAVTLDAAQIWQSAPGQAFPALPDGIANPHLRQVVRYLLDSQRRSLQEGVLPEQSFLWYFISAIDSAVEHIDPESFGRHQDLALLMGRPLALARVRIGFELLGLPAVHQGWNAFRQDLRHRRRNTEGFEEVLFPIRIGEHWQLNDGLVGYWMEKDGKFVDGLFHAPQSIWINDPNIHTNLTRPMLLLQRMEDEDQFLTLLLDPRGKVHATCGILPVKEMSIPPGLYQKALRNMEITFLTAPVLTSRHQLNLTLPQEPAYQWSWLEKAPEGAWKTVLDVETIEKAVFFQAVSSAQVRQLWELLLSEDFQWLRAIPGREDLAIIVPKEQRKVNSLPNAALGAQIQEVFDYYGTGMKPFDQQAGFNGRQRIVEGWLKLQATSNAE